MSWGRPGMFKSRSGMDIVSNGSESIISLFRGYIPFGFRNSKMLKRDFQLPTTKGVKSNISLSSCRYWYANLNSCEYLKSETHLRNTQVDKASSINKRIIKTSLIVGMVTKYWSWIVVAGYGLHYFVPARFGLYGVVTNISNAKRFKYLFFIAMKINIAARIVKKQNNFIFSSLVT